jgi:hypothetical protein
MRLGLQQLKRIVPAVKLLGLLLLKKRDLQQQQQQFR